MPVLTEQDRDERRRVERHTPSGPKPQNVVLFGAGETRPRSPAGSVAHTFSFEKCQDARAPLVG